MALHEIVFGVYVAERAISVATVSKPVLPVDSATFAPVTRPCASSETTIAAVPLIFAARTSGGISPTSGVVATPGSCGVLMHALGLAVTGDVGCGAGVEGTGVCSRIAGPAAFGAPGAFFLIATV